MTIFPQSAPEETKPVRGPWEVVGNPTEGYRVRHKDTGRHSTATPTHSLALAAKERDRLNAGAQRCPICGSRNCQAPDCGAR